MIFSTRYWGFVPFTVLASETVRFAILDMDTNFQSLSISNLVSRNRKDSTKRSHVTMERQPQRNRIDHSRKYHNIPSYYLFVIPKILHKAAFNMYATGGGQRIFFSAARFLYPPPKAKSPPKQSAEK